MEVSQTTNVLVCIEVPTLSTDPPHAILDATIVFGRLSIGLETLLNVTLIVTIPQ